MYIRNGGKVYVGAANGVKGRIKKCYVQLQIPYDECDYPVFQLYSNRINLKLEREGQRDSSAVQAPA